MSVSLFWLPFTRHPTPVLYPDNDEWKPDEWEGGCEDLHISQWLLYYGAADRMIGLAGWTNEE